MNRVILIGRLTSDPDLRFTSNDTAVATFTLAVDKFVNGEKQADFIRCKVWGKQAENFAEYQTKGSQVGIDGRIETGSYEKENGDKAYTTEVVAERVEYLSSKKVEDISNQNSNDNKTNRNNSNNKGNRNQNKGNNRNK